MYVEQFATSGLLAFKDQSVFSPKRSFLFCHADVCVWGLGKEWDVVQHVVLLLWKEKCLCTSENTSKHGLCLWP